MPDINKAISANAYKSDDRATYFKPAPTPVSVDIDDGPTRPIASGFRVNADS